MVFSAFLSMPALWACVCSFSPISPQSWLPLNVLCPLRDSPLLLLKVSPVLFLCQKLSLQVCCTPSALTCHGWCLQLFVVASNLISKLCHHFHQCSNLGKIESSPLGVSREIRTMKTIFAHFLQLNGKNQELDSSF